MPAGSPTPVLSPPSRLTFHCSRGEPVILRPNVDVLVAGAGVVNEDTVALSKKIGVAKLLESSDAGATLGGDKKPFVRRQVFRRLHDFVIGNRYGRAATFATNRLFTFNSIRFLQGREIEPPSRGFSFGNPFGAITDKTIHKRHVCSGCFRFDVIGGRNILRHEDVCFDSRRGGISGQRAAGITGGREWQFSA